MRNLLVTAVALAPLMAATGVQAEIVISTARTTPIQTSNATGSAPDSIRLASGGSIAVASGAAVTVDSSHSIDLDSGSSITMTNAASGATGILVNGGNTADVTVGGTITIADNITTPSDSDSDGDLDGPFANGTGRAGVRVVGATPLTGDVLVESTGSIQVDGNQSYGVSVESGLVGDLTTLGAVRVTGDQSTAIRTTGPVTGDVSIIGGVNAQGAGATGVSIGGDVDGRLTIESTLATTGYRYTSRPGATALEKLDADDLLQGGSGVVIAGDVDGGVLFDRRPADEDEDETDENGNDIPDTQEGTAAINTYGSAPAVVIGASDRDVALGTVGTGAEAYGFINRGSITGTGVYDDVTGNAVVVGGGPGQAVSIAGGFRNEGTVAATAFEAAATGLRFGAGASTPLISNTGSITAAAGTEGEDAATAVRIDAGANVVAIDNGGTIAAGMTGEDGDAIAIQDLSGTVASIRNTRLVQAAIVPNDSAADTDDDNLDPSDEVGTGSATAIDVRANTSGVSLVQEGLDDGDDDGKDETTDPDADGDGVDDADEPAIVGDVLLGSGADSVDIRNGQINGAIAFGAGADSLSITGGGVVRGVLSDSDGLLDVDISDGVLDARQPAPIEISNLNIGADGDLIVTIDPTTGANSGFVVSGAANLADGAGVGVRFNSLIQEPSRFTIIDANSLTAGDIDQAGVQENSPYLFVVTAGADVAAGDVYIDARRRTAAEAGLIPVEAQAFDAFYGVVDDNSALLNAFLSQTEREGFVDLYEQILPDHSGGPLLSLASGVDAVTRALTGRNASAAPGETSAWVQEINFYADKDKTDTYGFRSEGFGVAGGVERGTGVGAFGVSVAFTSSDIEDPEAEAEEVLSANLLELGLYWRAQGQNWTTWARAAGGYATFDATRALVGGGLNLRNESSWNGFTLSAAAGASYERYFGRINVRPELYAEYFSLSEEARTEEGGGDGFDLDIDERDGHLFATTAAVNVGYGFGANGWLRPELRVGWRQNISVDPGETIARFASGGPDFALTPSTIEGGGPIGGVRLAVGNELGMLTIAADAELLEDYVRYTLLLRASFRF